MSRFLRWVVNIVLIVAIIVACGLLIPPLAGVTTVIVDDVDMSTNLSRGSVTYAIPKPVSELEPGNDIVIQDSTGDYVYRVKAVDVASGTVELEDIKSTDVKARTETFTKDASKVLFIVPFIGYVTMAMKSTEGLIIIGLGIIFIIILFILSELWKKDSDEEDEDDEDGEEEKATAAPVDMSAHILEKVSSEIGSEVSSVIASEPDQANAKEAVGAVLADDIGVAGDTMPMDTPTKEAPEAKDKPAEASDSIIEALKKAMGDDASNVRVDEEPNVGEALGHSAEEQPEALSKKDLAEDLEPVEMAMPTCTADELIAQAKEAGHEPEVEKDEDLGLTILDYSKVL